MIPARGSFRRRRPRPAPCRRPRPRRRVRPRTRARSTRRPANAAATTPRLRRNSGGDRRRPGRIGSEHRPIVRSGGRGRGGRGPRGRFRRRDRLLQGRARGHGERAVNLPAIASQRHPIQPPIGRHHAVKTPGPDDAFVVGEFPRAEVDIDRPALAASRTVVELVRSHRQAGTRADHAQIEFVQNLAGERVDRAAGGRRPGHARHDKQSVVGRRTDAATRRPTPRADRRS